MYSAKTIILTLQSNKKFVSSTLITNKAILKVKMDGEGYDIVYTTDPVGRQVRYKKVAQVGLGLSGTRLAGQLIFPEAATQDRTVYVLIKE